MNKAPDGEGPPGVDWYKPASSQPSPAAVGAPGTVDAPDPPPDLFHTRDSNAWVDRVLDVQTTYERVILVHPGEDAPASVQVPRLELNRRGLRASTPPLIPTDSLPVNTTVKTLQDATLIARGGDLVAVSPGEYVGVRIPQRPDVGPKKYIRFVALGAPGAVRIVAAPASDPNWMFNLQATSHIIIDGFAFDGTAKSATAAPVRPAAGIFIDGNFSRTGRMSHHIVVTNVYSHGHRKWGLHATDSHTVLIQDSVFSDSREQHGAYVSDGSDHYVVRRNYFVNNEQAGFQANLDPIASMDELLEHPAMSDVGAFSTERAFLDRVFAKANETFGERNYPDGRGEAFIIEDNVLTGNGRDGGGAINLAAMSDSVIQNNVIYGNAAHGIAQWDDANAFDEQAREPGPQSPAEVRGPEDLPIFGCRRNVVANNTVLMSNFGRAALYNGNGSFGTRIYNNVLINDIGPSIELFNTSMLDLEGSHNVIRSVAFEGPAAKLTSLAKRMPDTPPSVTGYNQSKVRPLFVRGTDTSPIRPNGPWYEVLPNGPDYAPKTSSTVLVGRAHRSELPPRDGRGRPQDAGAIGALEP